tara:strand:+ start:150 stop:941 length:792 start_codon:yes stop_codon:yes gene_type:complete
MEIIDQIFSKIYTLLDRAVDFLKHLTRLEIMVKLNEMSRKIHSSLIVLSIIFLTLLFIILSVVSKSGLYITYAVLSILGILILSYLAKDFHGACEGLISANKTTLRSNAILRFSAILTLLFAVISFLASLVSFFTGDIDLSLLLLLYTLLLYINAGTLFNPSLINISISSDSSSGEDFITIFSSGLKSFVYFERIISSLLILSGIFQIIEIIIDYNFYFSDMYVAGGLIAGGIAFPLIAYLLFTILWFVNSLLLAILSLKRSN